MSPGLVSIVLPVHNQADHIGRVVQDYTRALDHLTLRYELILVVNGSRDASQRVCATLAKRDRRVRVLVSALGGWGLAVKLGLKAAKGDLLCYTNSSRTTATELTTLLLTASLQPGHAIKAARQIRGAVARRVGSFLFNLECRLLLGTRGWDVNGTPKVFPRAFGRLLKLTRDDDLIDAEFNVVCQREAYPLVEVPIYSHRRHGGQSTTSLKSAWRMYAGAASLAWQSRRTR